ncbi:hypothetical protein [Alkalithermobacter paradoxus]|uniref:Lipoprotein n=1 Tax=Alkalithermobacter paradoxus TaxID=29349 RepID=A0A1V4IBB3_9FIRM|nr:hypothetical protein CLOTH_04990 [[Clostridium] thermoalcaliphilum]
MKIKRMISFILVSTVVLVLSACQDTDVIGNFAIKSFEELINFSDQNVYFDEQRNQWVLQSPGKEKFIWSKDFSKNTFDIGFEIDATPFINAGLDTLKLPREKYIYNKDKGTIIIVSDLGDNKFEYSEDSTAKNSFKQIIRSHRKLIGYHEEMDHFGINLGDGNKFEWAKDISNNDKDIVFILNPHDFISAGVDSERLDGWKLVQRADIHGGEEKDKFVKPFDLN